MTTTPETSLLVTDTCWGVPAARALRAFVCAGTTVSASCSTTAWLSSTCVALAPCSDSSTPRGVELDERGHGPGGLHEGRGDLARVQRERPALCEVRWGRSSGRIGWCGRGGQRGRRDHRQSGYCS
ncbi:hypothetical protein NKG05_17840 [Oerskovia sp. M15]